MSVNEIYQTFRNKNHKSDGFTVITMILFYFGAGSIFILMLFGFIRLLFQPNKDDNIQSIILILFFLALSLLSATAVFYSNKKSNRLKKIPLRNSISISELIDFIIKDDKLLVYDSITDNLSSYNCYLFYLNNDSFLEPCFKIYVVYDNKDHSVNYTIHLHPENSYGRRWAGLWTYYSYLKKKRRFLQLVQNPSANRSTSTRNPE